MTLPASPNALSFSNINTEIGAAATTARDMAWVKTNTKPVNTISNVNSIRGYAWYQRRDDGNCNNGNCPSNCNCGGQTQNCNCQTGNCLGGNCNCNCSAFNCTAINCANCTACTAINCSNCDAQAYLQANCPAIPGNCNCTYNCNITGGVTINCSAVNCNCNCSVVNCNCACSTDGG